MCSTTLTTANDLSSPMSPRVDGVSREDFEEHMRASQQLFEQVNLLSDKVRAHEAMIAETSGAALVSQLCSDRDLEPKTKRLKRLSLSDDKMHAAAYIYRQLLDHLENCDVCGATRRKQVESGKRQVQAHRRPCIRCTPHTHRHTQRHTHRDTGKLILSTEVITENELIDKLVHIERACLLACLLLDERMHVSDDTAREYLTSGKTEEMVLAAIEHVRVCVSNNDHCEARMRNLIFTCEYFFHLRILLFRRRLLFVRDERSFIIKEHLRTIHSQLLVQNAEIHSIKKMMNIQLITTSCVVLFLVALIVSEKKI